MKMLQKIATGLFKKNGRILTRSLYSFQDENPKMKKLKEKQIHFQRNDGLPVYLKGGPMDKILFNTTLGLLGVGLIISFKFVYDIM